jgi:hypothetical protein
MYSVIWYVLQIFSESIFCGQMWCSNIYADGEEPPWAKLSMHSIKACDVCLDASILYYSQTVKGKPQSSRRNQLDGEKRGPGVQRRTSTIYPTVLKMTSQAKKKSLSKAKSLFKTAPPRYQSEGKNLRLEHTQRTEQKRTRSALHNNIQSDLNAWCKPMCYGVA